MPRMTEDLLVKCTGQAKKKRDESKEQFLRRITHLYCSERGIEAIVSSFRTRPPKVWASLKILLPQSR